MCGFGVRRTGRRVSAGGGRRPGMKGEIARMLVRGRGKGARLMRVQWWPRRDLGRVGLRHPCHSARLIRGYR
jgi:hypothetical protein